MLGFIDYVYKKNGENMSAEYNNFTITQGQKFATVVYMQDENGRDLPLTGMRARMTVLYGDYDGEIALQLTTENGGVEISVNKLYITAKTAQTGLLKFDKAVYELELIDNENEVTGWLRGDITILKGKV